MINELAQVPIGTPHFEGEKHTLKRCLIFSAVAVLASLTATERLAF